MVEALPETANPYRYNALSSPECIRLLRPKSGEPTESLQNNLVEAGLNDSTVHRALSYTWSPQYPMHVVDCGGFELLVGQNLWQCLRKLRHPSEDRTLWIDAVCINQADLAERSQQVQLMRRIYQSAASTVVWLGESYGSTRAALTLMNNLVTEFFREPAYYKNQLLTYLELEMLGVPVSDDGEFWKALDSLLWKAWYTRAWIVQEVAVSRSLTVFIGDGDMVGAFPFESLACAALYVKHHSLTRQTNVDPAKATTVAEYRAEIQTGGQTKLCDLLALGRRCYATEPSRQDL